MADDITSSNVVRYLQQPDLIMNNEFEIIKAVCDLVNSDTDEEKVNETVLRLLEHRSFFAAYNDVINNLLRALGLFPYISQNNLNARDALAIETFRPSNMVKWDIVFHKPQAYVYWKLSSKRSVVLSAPTSFGKSLIIDALVANMNMKEIVIIVPTLALIDETRRRLQVKFNQHYKIITHGSQAKAKRNIYILTQERLLDIIDQMDNIDFFVIDEFYKLSPTSDQERSMLLNSAFYALTKKCSFFYMLGPNIQDIPEGFQERFNCDFVRTDFITVVSDIILTRLSNKNPTDIISLCKKLNEPTLVYCQSPTSANKVAEWLLNSDINNGDSKSNEMSDWISLTYHPEWNLVELINRGIGLHHGRLPRALSHQMVKAFNDGVIKILICTSTLIEGVNTSAKNVIIFDNKVATKKFDHFTFNNISGRAGRMFEHFIGRVFLFHDAPPEGLPFVDIPIFTQEDSIPTHLLIQMDAKDLNKSSRIRLDNLYRQEILSLETMKKNVGIEIDNQVALAKDILAGHIPASDLQWSGEPQSKNLYNICDIIWRYFFASKRFSPPVLSSKQLAWWLTQLREHKTTRELIKQVIENNTDENKTISQLIEGVFYFLRQWANYYFPRYLMATDRIQKEILTKMGCKYGDYAHCASMTENFYLKPPLASLDEYGIPVELTRKIERIFNECESLDDALRVVAKLNVEKLRLHPFEKSLIQDTQEGLGVIL